MMVSGLQAAPAGPPSPTDDSLDDNSIRFISYLHKISGIIDPDTDAVCTDHGYSKPWNWRPENVYVKPTRKLFFSKNPETSRHKYNEEIDVENVPESMIPDIPCDMSRSRQSLEDFQRLSNFAKPEQDDNWEENINKTFWTPIQTRIFNRVFRILTAERLSRLAKVSSKLEPIYRRVSVDTASRKFREILASSGWDWQLIQWLHILLFECLPKEYLSIYLDILQTLRTTIPQLIDKMISAQPNIIGKNDTVTWETLGSLLKRSWDPLTNFLNSNRPKKLPGNPILLIIPSGFGNTITSSQQKWITQFDSFGKTINISTNLGIPQNRVTMLSSMDQLVQNIRSKIQDTRNNYQSRPIILIGFNTGAALACQIAQMEHVTAVVCLGFPFYTAEGKRGSPDDILMDMRCPVMFIIGQNATLIRADDIEEAREKMPVETSLIVVGSADDNLRISRNKKILEGITQSLVDRCIAEEIGDFIGNILVQPHPLPLRPIGPASSSNSNNNNNNSNNNNKEIKKRKTSTSSSVDSEISLSNVNKKSRPNTPVEKGQNQPRQVSSSTQINTNLINSGTNGTKKKPRMSANQRIEQQLAKIQQQQLQLQQQQQQQHLLQQQQLQQQQQAIQTMENTNNNGLTVQIGSLASLAPIGPIKFNSGQVGAGVGRGNSVTKSTNTPGRGQKFIQTGNIGKRSSLTVTGMTKGVGRGAGLVDKQDTKLLITPGTSGSNSQIKITPSTSTGSQSKVVGNTNVNLAGQLSNRKGQLNKTTNFPSGLSITPVNFNDIPTSALSTKISSTSITKEMDVKMSSDCSPSLRNHQENIPTPITILPVPGKMINSQQNLIPKVSLNNKNTIEKSTWQIANEYDIPDANDIPDIPIIIASDDETINSIETSSLPLSIINSISCEKRDENIPTKLVLLSNKEDNKLNPSNLTETLITKNHIIQTNHVSASTGLNWDNQTASSSKNIANNDNKPTIKYTKIILAKKNTLNQSGERVILTKNTKKLPTNQAYNSNELKTKIENTFLQSPVEIFSGLAEESGTVDQVNFQIQDEQGELTTDTTTEITNIDQPSATLI